ncbi:MAG: 16S rRNA processing protein RimM [Pseudobdellovibrionaceae bacterium]|nr:MAG: 16S rRNA processing protein RimM [Pseudobdellovibrionaceae bacterium]
MEIPQWIKVGWAREAHGLKGEVYLEAFSETCPWAKQLEWVHLRDLNSPVAEAHLVSMRILEQRPFKKGMLLKLENINDRTGAESLRGMQWYIPQGLLVSESGENLYLHEILGFQLKDLHSQKSGVIFDFSSNGAQDLLVVKTDSGLYEVPFVDELIDSINFDSRVVNMNLPEGLLEP